MSRIFLGLAAALVLNSAATAADNTPVDITKEVATRCGYAPLGSVTINGATATKDEMERGKLQVEAFMRDTDLFQNCIIAVAITLKDKLTEADKVKLQKFVDDSQKEKESVGVEYNQAVDAYNTAHPGNSKEAKPPKEVKPTKPAH